MPASHQFPLYLWKGWLSLPYSCTLVICLIPPAARACQRRSEENRAPGLIFQPALARHAKPPGAGSCCPELTRLEQQARWRAGRMGKSCPVPEQRARRRGARCERQQWVGAFSCGVRGARSVCSMAKRPCAPWKRACCCCRGEQRGSVPHTASLFHLLAGHRVRLAGSCSCRRYSWAWLFTLTVPGPSHSLCCWLLLQPWECAHGAPDCLAGNSLATLTSACPPSPVCYGSQDFCFPKLLIFSLMKK